MRPILSLFAFFFFLPALCPAQTPANPISKEMALKAIALFCENPLSEEAEAASAVIVHFAEKSPEVEVDADSKYIPWFVEEPQPQYASLLLTAYIAGNTKSQLESGRNKNDSLAGILQTIATYRQLQKQEPDLKMPAVEKLIALNEQNKLRQYLETP